MHSLSKQCTSNFTNRDTNLFGTSFDCTPYQKRCTSKFQKHRQRFILDQFCMHSLSKKKMHPKFNMYRHRISEAERLMTASCPLHFTTFIFDLQFIYLPSILLISILFYSSIGFYYPFHSFFSILFILIVV